MRRRLLQSLAFEDGCGVDVGLLIDAHVARARIAEVGIGRWNMTASPVTLSRPRLAGRLHVDQFTAMHPGMLALLPNH